MEDRHLSLSEVAGAMGVSERTVRRWIKSGKLRAYKPGRDYRIPESALRALVKESEISPKAPASLSQRSLFNGLEEERRAAQEAAAENARLLREHGLTRMADLLSALRESMERREDDTVRRGYVTGIDKLLKEAYEARTALLRNFLQGMSPQARRAVEEAEGWVPDSDWEEVREADRFCVELVNMIRDAGFPINESASRPPRIENAA